MIVEVERKVICRDYFIVKQSIVNKDFVIEVGDYKDQPKFLYVTREELELISKAITEELNKGDR